MPAPEEMPQRKAPTLPNPDKRKWHRFTRAWWRRVWASPMASEYIETDVDGLARLALLIDDYYKATDPKQRKELMQEIRLQEARFGLSPVDRSRLQWEIAKGDEASRRRRPAQSEGPSQESSQDPARDPRQLLRRVK